MSGAAVADALAQHRAEEQSEALRALLMRPLMTATDPTFPTVRRHADTLREWLARETGWVLHVERDFARLYKLPADHGDASRTLPGFDRQRCIVLCLAGAVLERADPQVTLRTLGERLLLLAADPELAACGFSFTLERASERRDLVHVCRLLVELGVLARVAGDEDAYVQRTGDALYDVRRRVLGAVLACARGPSTFAPGTEPTTLAARVAAIAAEFVPDSAEGRRTAARHALARRLLDDPVVYFDELEDEEREYLVNQRGPMAARLAEGADLHAEQRAEGLALVDAHGELTDARLPADGTEAHATLLVAQHLAERAATGEAVLAQALVEEHLRDAARRYGRYWRKQAREPGAERELTATALARLAGLKLVTHGDGVVRARPALARFAVGEPELRQAELLER